MSSIVSHFWFLFDKLEGEIRVRNKNAVLFLIILHFPIGWRRSKNEKRKRVFVFRFRRTDWTDLKIAFQKRVFVFVDSFLPIWWEKAKGETKTRFYFSFSSEDRLDRPNKMIVIIRLGYTRRFYKITCSKTVLDTCTV